jgi:DNA-binding FadR family transcriptional regulator
MRLNRLSIPRAYQAIQSALEDAIMNGMLSPGDPLPTEAELAEQFGVARHTVREGMRAVEQSGLVKRNADRRLHVVLPAYDALASRASRALHMQGVSFRELWEVSAYAEVCAIELAMENVDRDFIERLEANLSEMEAALSREKSIVELDVRFHNLISEGAGNRVLQMSREPVSLLFYPSVGKLCRHPRTRDLAPRRLLEAHRHIVGGIRNRDGAEARLWMKRHMDDFKRGWEMAGMDIDGAADMLSV